MQSKFVVLAGAAASLMLNGCAGGGGGLLGIGAIVGDRNLAAAEPLFSKEEEGCLGSADRMINVIFGTDVEELPSKGRKPAQPCSRMQTNLHALISTTQDKSAPYSIEQRNELIDALLASSNRKCTRFASLLKSADGAMNAGLSVGSIITGGLGSILGGVNTARALSGSASILSGSRAALNDTYLSNQTIHVLVAAFEKARRSQRRIITNRQACPVSQYTLMRGIEDAYAYHQSCSLVAGLAETALSIERSENPGLDTMRTQLNELANLRRQAEEVGKAGPITPIAAAPTPVSLDKLVAADKALTDAQKALGDARAAEQVAKDDLSKAGLALAEQMADDKTKEMAAVAAATAKLTTASATVVKLTTARDAGGQTRNAEVRALVQATAQAPGSTEPETRVCPFT